MIYRVLLTEQAHHDLQQACHWWAENRSLEQADQWYSGFAEAIHSLAENPGRCSLAQENKAFADELRQLNYGLGRRPTHRAVFTTRPDMVLVLRIRHLARKHLSFGDL